MTTTDEAVAAVLSGDREAFRSIVEGYETKVRIIIAAILPRNDQVDDIVQETFVVAFRKLRDYQSGSDFSAWIKTIARHVALNERRGWMREQRMKRSFRADIEHQLEGSLVAALTSDNDDALDRLGECLAKLGEPARTVLDAFYWQGQPSADIAKARQQTDTWVRGMLFRARSALANCLQAKGVLRGG
ncbi:MAG: sigma-70 family RNA polymerase sigma factor [Planctomycetes bacterium]|nr:sigma-70 family RNA polymerase sigma factor [Planctomycetota bacterium]